MLPLLRARLDPRYAVVFASASAELPYASAKLPGSRSHWGYASPPAVVYDGPSVPAYEYNSHT